ncbi:hypothetical protein DPEC_G00043720 [Dallia pectoralis]|uniref:Uncharacterized protein n=1 Tax=Dallia pectoralis TaxID=75939 RepID=A0ACC2H938_DALPE|nr:hypothetical protein DPEC_G00043720 [Dallia pectoralis]
MESETEMPKFTTSLVNLPKISTSDVVRIVEQHSWTATSKLERGYKFFFEDFIYNYEDCFPSWHRDY